MSSKWNYIFGATTIALIIGGTVYAIVKSKQAKDAEEDSITLDEARAIVKERKANEDEIHFEAAIEVVEETGTRKIQGVKSSLVVYDEESEEEDENEEEDEDDLFYDRYTQVTDDIEGPSLTVAPLRDFMYIEDGIDPKEDKTLRYDHNSDGAKHQFIRMELADWRMDHDVYRIMLQLFEFPFVPTTTGDEVVRTQIIDYKVQFYGFGSKWNREVSFADVIFHYARTAEFNCEESVQYWVEYFLDFTEIHWDSTSEQMDTALLRLNSHAYFNEERQTFGLFGLTRESMDQAIKIANRNLDRSVTYDIEFNEFLKSII